MEETYAIEREQTDKERLIQLVGFVMGKELFGVDILMVQEIIREAFITPIPNSPEFIEGVINLRGSIIPVIDLRKRLGLLKDDKQSEDTWILILNIEDRVTGFIVDSVSEVLKIQKGTIKPPPDIVVAGLQSQYIEGVCKIDKGLMVLLDFDRILLIDEIKKLKDLERD